MTPPKIVGTKIQNWANLKYEIASDVLSLYYQLPQDRYRTPRQKSIQFNNHVSILSSMSNVKSNIAFLTLTLCWKISKDLGFERIEFEKLEKSVAFLPSEVFLVKCQYLVLLYYNQSLETTRFHIQPIKDNCNWWFKSSPIHQNYWKYSKHKILAAYLGVLRLLVRGLQKIINIEFIRHFRLSWIQLSFFWNTMRIITSVQNHLNLSAFYT